MGENKKYTCAYCGRSWYTDGSGGVESGGYWFCSSYHMQDFFKRQAGSNNSSDNTNASSSSGAGSDAGAAMAGAGIGAAAAGIGAAAAGVGAVAKGAGSILKGVGKGIGAYGDLFKSGIKQSQDNTAYAYKIKDFEFSEDNPETLDKEIFNIYQIAKSKSLDPRSLGTQPIARRKLLDEFQRLSVNNPELYKKYAAMHEEVKKVKPIIFFLFGGIALLFVIFFIWWGASEKSSDAEWQRKMTAENERLNTFVQEIDQNISDKDYDTALYNASKLHWSIGEHYYSREGEKWDSQREDLIKSINSISGKTPAADATSTNAETETSNPAAAN